MLAIIPHGAYEISSGWLWLMAVGALAAWSGGIGHVVLPRTVGMVLLAGWFL